MSAHRPLDPVAGARRGTARHGDARAARHAGARARHRLHRPRDRADRRLRRACSPIASASRPSGVVGAGRRTGRRAARRVAADVDRAALARRAGSDHRRRVRARRNGRRAAARGQRARQRASARPARRPDPLGAAAAAADRRGVYAVRARAVVRRARAARTHRLLPAVRVRRDRCRCSSSACISCSRR